MRIQQFLNPGVILIIGMIHLSVPGIGQSTNHGHEDADHHSHHKNEIGIANAPVYFVKEKILSYGLHAHYIRTIANSKFGIGAGYERIFDEHKHNTIGLVFSYRPAKHFSFYVSPGLAFEDESDHTNFAFHLESSYEFEVNDFHIGPVLEFAYDVEDYHISLGLHIGYGF